MKGVKALRKKLEILLRGQHLQHSLSAKPVVAMCGSRKVTPSNASFWNRFETGTKCTTTGFGTTAEGGEISNELRQVTLPLRALQYCERKYSGEYTVRFPFFVCYRLSRLDESKSFSLETRTSCSKRNFPNGHSESYAALASQTSAS